MACFWWSSENVKITSSMSNLICLLAQLPGFSCVGFTVTGLLTLWSDCATHRTVTVWGDVPPPPKIKKKKITTSRYWLADLAVPCTYSEGNLVFITLSFPRNPPLHLALMCCSYKNGEWNKQPVYQAPSLNTCVSASQTQQTGDMFRTNHGSRGNYVMPPPPRAPCITEHVVTHASIKQPQKVSESSVQSYNWECRYTEGPRCDRCTWNGTQRCTCAGLLGSSCTRLLGSLVAFLLDCWQRLIR